MKYQIEALKAQIRTEVMKNSHLAEFFLPGSVSALLDQGKATVQVLRSADKWYGVTYKEDKEMVVEAFKQLKAEGVYPELF